MLTPNGKIDIITSGKGFSILDKLENENPMSTEDVSGVIKDYEFWKSFADAIGAQVIGFTLRESVTIKKDGSTIQIPGWFVKEFLRITKEKDLTQKEK